MVKIALTASDKGDGWAANIKLRRKLNGFPEDVPFTAAEAAIMPLGGRPNRMNTKSVEKLLEDLKRSGEPLEKESQGKQRYKRTGKISINPLLDSPAALAD